MLGALLIGIGLGLSLSIAAGPIMVMIVKTSLEREAKQAAIFASGVWLSDTMYAILTYAGVNWITELAYSPYYRDKLGFVGAMILLVFGIGAFMSEETEYKSYHNLRKRDVFKLFLKGLGLNTFNPFTIIFWLGISGGVVAHQATSGLDATLIYGGLLGTVIIADVFKIILADRISVLLKSHVMLYIRRSVGILMLVFSAVLLYKSFM